MQDEIKKRIEKLQEIKKEITAIEKKIATTQTDFKKKVYTEKMAFEKRMSIEKSNYEHLLTLSEIEKIELSNEARSIGKDIVSIRLGDLIEELAYLKEIKTSEVSVIIDPIIFFSGNYSIRQMSKLINTIYYDYIINLVVELSGNYKKDNSMITLFNYLIRLNAKFSDIESDGKTLMEHCTAKGIYDARAREYRTELYVDRNINDIVLNIPLSYLVRETDSSWYPVDLITQAIINCRGKGYQEETSKKKVKSLSNDEISK